MSTNNNAQPLLPRTLRRLSVPIIFFWLGLAAVVNVAAPKLETVGREHSASLSAPEAPSVIALKRIGEVFEEFNSDSTAMLVLEGEQPLRDDAHRYYDNLVRQLNQDKKHVQHVEDYWSDPLTTAASQSADGKAAYVQLNLAGDEGTPLSNESVRAVRNIVAHTPSPQGVKAYLTGPAPLNADTQRAGDKSMLKMTAITIVVITVMIIIVYRNLITVALLLAMVGVEFASSRGIVAVLGDHELLPLTTFATSMLTSLAIAAGTDYGIFFIGRYQEQRRAGDDPEAAYYTAFRGVAPVVLGSGLTIAGALYCLSFTRLPFFNTLAAPCTTGMLVAVAAVLTLAPAVLTVSSRFGLLEPRLAFRARRWQRVGTAVVRWPVPILVASCAIALVGMLALPAYKTNYNVRYYIPSSAPANIGYQAANRHFSEGRLNPGSYSAGVGVVGAIDVIWCGVSG